MLNEQKLRYVALRIAGVNKLQSAIGAGYSAKSAQPAASRLERDLEVAAAILAGGVEPAVKMVPKGTAARLETTIDQVVEDALNPIPLIDKTRYEDPKNFLLDEMNDPLIPKAVRHDAAKALMPFLHAKKGELGKKEQRELGASNTKDRTSFKPRVVGSIK